MFRTAVFALAALLLGLPSAAIGQTGDYIHIWDIPLGTPAADLPDHMFFMPACGTNGGPPSVRLDGFTEFASCPADEQGLHEVSFIYDDRDEYVARARHLTHLLASTMRNAIDGQPVIWSVLIDDSGVVRGYRIFTDPRAEPEVRLSAHATMNYQRGRYGVEGWACEDRPQGEREQPVEGLYINRLCQLTLEDQQVRLESRLYRKPGQREFDELGNPTVNQFESWSRLEVVQTGRPDAVEISFDPAPPAQELPPGAERDFLDGTASDCPQCDLADMDLSYRDLTEADLSGADLSGANLHRAVLRSADFSDADLSGAALTLVDARLAKFAGADLGAALMHGASASQADFSTADLTGSYMSRADFNGAVFDGAVLDDADFGDARMTRASLAGVSLSRTYLFAAYLVAADLSRANAHQANFASAVLRDARMSEGRFILTDFYGADLRGTDMRDADFTQSRLSLANTFGADMTGASFEEAIMPN